MWAQVGESLVPSRTLNQRVAESSQALRILGDVLMAQSSSSTGRRKGEPAIRVLLLSVQDARASGIIEGLARESIRARAVPLEAMSGTVEAACDVVLVWLPHSPPPGFFSSCVAWVRENWPRAAIIGCIPSGTMDDSVLAFEAGFDDFVAGNSSVREVSCRINVIHRRFKERGRYRRAVGGSVPIRIDVLSREAHVDGRSVRLSATELAVLSALVAAAGGALSRQELLEQAWGEGSLEVGERAVDNVVLRLRRKLGDADLIETVRGVGFRLRRS
jgi:DNA-binding response OmpR family regulator